MRAAHLTLDLDGNVRFGPDAEWLFPDASASADFWSRSLPALTPVPFSHEQGAQEARLDQMLEAIRSYLPGVQREGLAPDYAGIRPKLVPPGAAFRDFGVLLHDSARLEQQRIWQEALADAAPGTVSGAMITLAGIESPGLTSSLAIGELVADLVARRVWADARRTRVLKRQNVDHAAGLDGWA
jgi:L-2-hydroxyglutarate oxidase LhgO